MKRREESPYEPVKPGVVMDKRNGQYYGLTDNGRIVPFVKELPKIEKPVSVKDAFKRTEAMMMGTYTPQG